MIRRKVAGLAVLAVAVASLVVVSPDRHVAHGSATPNIVFVLTDDQTYESVATAMPYVSSRSDWITFDNAFLNVSLCCPSRASILSGQYSHHTGVEEQRGDLFRDDASIGTWLQAAGYKTALYGKYFNFYPWTRGNYVPPGWDDWAAFVDVATYFGYTLNENHVLTQYGGRENDYSTDVLDRKAVSFINAQSGPFFLEVATNAPHGNWQPAPKYARAFSGTPMPHAPNFNEQDMSDKPAWVRRLQPRNVGEMDTDRRNAYRTLLSVDDMMRDIFTALTNKGILDNTVVVFMTDNGFSFGEHRYFRKRCEYDECMRTPLLVRYPGQAGRHVSQLAQNVDLASTFTELAGTAPTIRQDGRSLVPLLRGETPADWRTGVLLHWVGGADTGTFVIPPFWGIRTLQWKYVEIDTGERELYDMVNDPYELQNQAANPAYASVMADLAVQLQALKTSQGTDPGSTTTTELGSTTTSTEDGSTTTTELGSTTTSTTGSTTTSSTEAVRPTAPLNLRAEAVPGGIQLTWDPPTTGTPTSYRIFRGSQSTQNLAVTVPASQTTFLDTSMRRGSTRYYRVAAVNAAGQSPKSALVHATRTS